MLGIKYITRKWPNTKLGRWQLKEYKNPVFIFFQHYIFNDFIGLLTHGIITLLFAIGTNFFLNNDQWYEIMYYCCIALGIIPMFLNMLPYMIYAIIIWPITALINLIKEKWNR